MTRINRERIELEEATVSNKKRSYSPPSNQNPV